MALFRQSLLRMKRRWMLAAANLPKSRRTSVSGYGTLPSKLRLPLAARAPPRFQLDRFTI
ncbi:unnamed protein product [Cylicocyclus nassatus]|uniref:Uncharacterized protein n=1 Tax=Cylicocyclus nassatus TaxID=53992 RepID=A0AA36HDG5_CYLNA|nr:unnamed protein product [Cylicocyclus nassatus]